MACKNCANKMTIHCLKFSEKPKQGKCGQCPCNTFDGYEFSRLVSYLDSDPRISTSSELFFKNSIGKIFKTSSMMDMNLTMFRSSFWLIRLPINTLASVVHAGCLVPSPSKTLACYTGAS
jgi:hypothetical protein